MTINSKNSDTLPQDSAANSLAAVLDKLGEIARAASTGSFVFRGEPKCYEEISSSLYREYKTRLEPFGIEGFDIHNVQNEILDDAARYTGDLTPQDLLSQLQHYGHPTNLIDFSADYLIALFFACASEPNCDGRVTLLNSESVPLFRMRTPANRIKAQKSVFVDPPSGVISPDQTISIPRDLKPAILEYLFHGHDITADTMFDDIHGFIKNASMHRSAYAEFHIAGLFLSRGNLTDALEHYNNSIRLNGSQQSSFGNRGHVLFRLGKYDEAIQDYTHAISLDPHNKSSYKHRGFAYLKSGQPDLAEKDFSEAIRLDEDLDEAYGARAMARVKLGNFEGVIEDMTSAINLNPQSSSAYGGRGVAYWALEKNQLALRDFETAIEIDPTYANAYINRANLHMDLESFHEAIEDYGKYLRLDGDDLACAQFRRGVAHIALENYAEARKDLINSLELEPDVASRVFETPDKVSDFIREHGLENNVPADLLELLKPKK